MLTPLPLLRPLSRPLFAPASGAFRYYRFWVYDDNGLANQTQFSEVTLYLGGIPLTPVSASWAGGLTSLFPDGAAANAIDGSLSTKAGAFLSSFPLGIVIDYGAPVSGDSFDWATGNDNPGRDPVLWTFDASNDQSTWTTLHAQSTPFSPPFTRSVYVGPFTF